MNGIFWLKDVEAYAVNPGGTYATNVDLSCLHAAGFIIGMVGANVQVSHPCVIGKTTVRPGVHLLYFTLRWAESHCKKRRELDLDARIGVSIMHTIPCFEEAEEEF